MNKTDAAVHAKQICLKIYVYTHRYTKQDKKRERKMNKKSNRCPHANQSDHSHNHTVLSKDKTNVQL